MASVPTFKSIHKGKVVSQFSGANKAGLERAIAELVVLK